MTSRSTVCTDDNMARRGLQLWAVEDDAYCHAPLIYYAKDAEGAQQAYIDEMEGFGCPTGNLTVRQLRG